MRTWCSPALVGQQGPGGGALAEHPLHDPASDDRALARRQRIRLLGWLRGGQLVFDVVELGEEVPHRLGAVGGLDRGSAAEQPVHDGGEAFGRRGERALGGEPLGQRGAALRGRLAGEDQVAERAEPEHVELGGRRVGAAELRRQVRPGRALDVRGQRDDAGTAGARAGRRDRCAVRGPGRDLPVADPQPRVPAVQLHVDAAGRERPVVQVAAVGVIDGLGELPDHLHPRLDRQVTVVRRHELVKPLPVLAVPEDDGRAGVVLVAVLLGADDAVVGDPLERQVLPSRRAAGRLARLLGSAQLGQVDADPADLVIGQRGIAGEVVLPGRARVEGTRLQLVRADLPVLVLALDADLPQQLVELLGQGWRHPVLLAARRLVQQALPDTGQAGLAGQPVAAVDADPLKFVQVTAQVRRGEEDRGLNAGNPVPDVERPGCLPELTRKFFSLQVGEMQRVLECPGPFVTEQPGGAVVRGPAGVALDLHKEQATRGWR